MPPLKLVFAGTPAFAVPGLRACIASGCEVAAVYTQPDRPAGRGRRPVPSAVKQAAQDAGIPVEQPESLKDPAARQCLRNYAPDLIVVIAWGQILPRKLLAIPRVGCWNVHASLLPRWRGAAPIQRAILAGDSETGVCLMRMQAGLDTGPVLLSAATPIEADDTGGSLHDRLADLGAQVLAEGLRRTLAGEVLPETPQPDVGVRYASKLDKAEAKLDFALPAAVLERKVRAFDPWPVAEAELEDERARIWRAAALPGSGPGHQLPGTIVAASKAGIDIACGDGVLRILELQRAGGRVIGAVDYLNARPDLRR